MKEIKKIIFYSGLTRIFREALIGNLYEISQVYPVILLAEDLDGKLKEILENKQLFPKIEKIIFVHQHSGPQDNVFKKNWRLRNLAKKIIYAYKPDVVIAPDDILPFEMYLMRFSKRINALSLAVQPSNPMDCTQARKSADLTNAYLKFPNFLPLFIRISLVKCRKRMGHFLHYWVLPILAGEKPFWGMASFILRNGGSGTGDSDFQIVFSKRDYDFYAKDKVLPQKLYVLDHPLKRETRDFLKGILIGEKNLKDSGKVATLLIPPEEIGFRNNDYSLISKEEKLKTRIEIIKTVLEALKDWKIFIKPHPDFKNFSKNKEIFESISDLVDVVDPKESSSRYVELSKVVFGLPPANSTALSNASLLFPEKMIFALGFDKELLGDFYKGSEDVEYIDDKNKFIEILNLIAENKYQKENQEKKELIESKEFRNAAELIEYLYEIKK